MKILKILALLGALMAGPLSYSADGKTGTITKECGVPFCNIEEALETWKQKYTSGGERVNYAKSLMKEYENEDDFEVLNNLYRFAKRMLAELTEIYAEDTGASWVINSGKRLYGFVLLKLMKASEVDAETLIEYFKKLSDQGQRGDALKSWQKRAIKIENIRELEELSKFAESARDHCRDSGDAHWMVNRARNLLGSITVRLRTLDPAHEGVYKVESTNGRIFPFDRIVVMESSSHNDKLIVTFYNKKYRHLVYRFNDVKIEGNRMSALKIGNNNLAVKFEMTYDRSSGHIEGELLDTVMTKSVKFSGKQITSTREIARGENIDLGKEHDVEGFYKGRLGKISGTLAVRSFEDRVYSATFTAKNSKLIMHFQGKYFPKRGVLSLTNNNRFKLVISLQEGEEKRQWKGMAFSTDNAASFKADFTKK